MAVMLGQVFPGDTVHDVKLLKGVVVLGPGLKQNESSPNTVLITCAGILRHKPPNIYYVEHDQKRYVPKRGDFVVGVVIKKAGDSLKVDIGSAEPASLSMLAFEGATKKQKPDVKLGDVIYGKLLNAHREMEPEMVCIDSYFKAGKMGALQDGMLMNIPTSLATRLLEAENPILGELGKVFPYEVAVGLNGKVWINARTCKDVLTVMRCLEAAEQYDHKVIVELCKQNN